MAPNFSFVITYKNFLARAVLLSTKISVTGKNGMKRFTLGSFLASLLLTLNLGSAQTLQADYQLQGVLTSSVGTIGPLTVTGDPTQVNFITDTVMGNTQQVLQIGLNNSSVNPPAGVQTQTNPFIDPANYSAVLLADYNISAAFNTGITKVFDFKNLSSDAGLYIDDATGKFAFYDGGMVPMVLGVSTATAVSGQYIQIVLTRDSSTNTVTLYANGVSQFSFVDTTGLAVLGDASNTGKAYLTLFQDDGQGIGGSAVDEGTRGNIARLRLYNGPLSAAQVASLDTTVVPEPTSFVLLGIGALVLARAAKIRQRSS